jgi:hypothetical protein
LIQFTFNGYQIILNCINPTIGAWNLRIDGKLYGCFTESEAIQFVYEELCGKIKTSNATSSNKAKPTMLVDLNEYKFYFISEDSVGRESCNVFYADYVLAKSKKEAVEKVYKDVEYDEETETFNYVGSDTNMENYYDEYFIQESGLEVAL